jgi:hypothetical protein
MHKVQARPSPEGSVLVVSSNAETLDGLHDYFSQAGIASLSRRVINPLAELAASLRAVVVFPDDFPAHEVASYLSMLRVRRSRLAILIVTKEPPVYCAMTAADNRPLSAIVLPRPAFGWTILDAVRAIFSAQGERDVDAS